jgi:hypothetical protein
MAEKELLSQYAKKTLKALERLEYSHKKVLPLPTRALDDELLETWESYTSRFARVVDIFLTKYLKARTLIEDPAFEGTLRDYCNMGERLKILDSAESWMSLRELRNATAHEYEEEDLSGFFERLRTEAPRVLKIRSVLEHPNK